MKKFALIAALLLGLSTSALAATKTVTLSVPGMYCAVCPVTVKKALSRVKGVSRVAVDYDKKEAIVVFDDAKAKVEDLTWATEEAGYPSKPIGPARGETK
ncbi:MAG: mercury resistance system periplasmic binding protein MerP [Betaproteobacteria bacterium]|nr:mercury resistance system periplasmic binding protein MerP [Betaproteobacteria bacterium]